MAQSISRKRAKDRTYYSEHTEEIKAKVKRHYTANRKSKIKYVQEYQMRRKLRAMLYLGGLCRDCKQEPHPNTAQFHHRDPTQKLFTITTKELGSPKVYPWDTMIVPELDKCDLLCANCHFKEHGTMTDDDINRLREEVREEYR